MGLDDVEWRSGGTRGFIRRSQKRLEGAFHRGERSLPGIANQNGVLIPIGGFRELVQGRIGFREPIDAEHELHAATRLQGRHASGIRGESSAGAVARSDHQYREAGRDLNDGTELTKADPLERAAQFRPQRRQGLPSQEAAIPGAGVDRLASCHVAEVRASLQSLENGGGLVTRIHDDDAQRHLVGRSTWRQLGRLQRRGEAECSRNHSGGHRAGEARKTCRSHHWPLFFTGRGVLQPQLGTDSQKLRRIRRLGQVSSTDRCRPAPTPRLGRRAM